MYDKQPGNSAQTPENVPFLRTTQSRGSAGFDPGSLSRTEETGILMVALAVFVLARISRNQKNQGSAQVPENSCMPAGFSKGATKFGTESEGTLTPTFLHLFGKCKREFWTKPASSFSPNPLRGFC